MWVRSQDKENLIKATDIFVAGKSVYIAKGKEEEVKIGRYATPERAMEVLDEIQEVIKHPKSAEYQDCIVYQMPKE